MKKLIRKAVFESNSSSSHSVSIADETKQFVLDTIYPDQNGIIYVEGGEFGWEYAKYNDAKTKLNYAFQDNVNQNLIKDVVMEQTGAVDVIFGDIDKGYIDHQSVGTINDEILGSKETLRTFIFNKNSWLFTGNDNQTPDPTFYHVPEFRDGKQINPVYKYKLSIGEELSTYFLTYPNDEEIEDAINSLLSEVLVDKSGHIIKDDNIYFQIMRERNCYRKSYSIAQDYSTNQIIFTHETDFYYFEKELKEQNIINKDMNWHEKYDIMKKELLKRPNLFRILNFTITEINETNSKLPKW